MVLSIQYSPFSSFIIYLIITNVLSSLRSDKADSFPFPERLYLGLVIPWSRSVDSADAAMSIFSVSLRTAMSQSWINELSDSPLYS